MIVDKHFVCVEDLEEGSGRSMLHAQMECNNAPKRLIDIAKQDYSFIKRLNLIRYVFLM